MSDLISRELSKVYNILDFEIILLYFACKIFIIHGYSPVASQISLQGAVSR